MKFLLKAPMTVKSILKPHYLSGGLAFAAGGVFLKPVLIQFWHIIPQASADFTDWKALFQALGLMMLPLFVLGVAVMLMEAGLLSRARIAWSFSLLLLIATTVLNFLFTSGEHYPGYVSLLGCICLLWYWRDFNRSSLAAGTLFALISITSLLVYALCGSLYLGDEFHPAISELSMAFYFSMVSMSTVGFGDIVPVTAAARLFTVSIIILGITVFTTSVTVVIGPVIGGSLKRIIKGRVSLAMRKDHIIVIGNSALAQNVYEGLAGRNENVVVVAHPEASHHYPPEADVVCGEPSSDKILRDAGADKARYVLVLCDDDSDNAFIVLAAKDIISADTRILALVNSNDNLSKIRRVQPDYIFPVQRFISEILLQRLSGEETDPDMLLRLLNMGIDE